MTEESNPENRPIEELLNVYHDLFVERDKAGFLNIYKRLSQTATRIIGVSVLDNIDTQESPEIVVAGRTAIQEEDQMAEKNAKFIVINPQNNPNTYLRIRRLEGSRLEIHVTYPQDETKRLDPKDLFEDAIHGLEIFDAFSNLTNRKEKERYQERIFDGIADLDVANYWKIIRDMDQSSGEDLESFVRNAGIDAGSLKGSAKFAFLVMRGIKDFYISSIRING